MARRAICWLKSPRSTVTYGFTQVTNSPMPADATFHNAHCASANIIWRPVKTGEVGFEYLLGKNAQKSGASATASRL